MEPYLADGFRGSDTSRTEKCYAKCVPSPGSSLGSKEEVSVTCLKYEHWYRQHHGRVSYTESQGRLARQPGANFPM